MQSWQLQQLLITKNVKNGSQHFLVSKKDHLKENVMKQSLKQSLKVH